MAKKIKKIKTKKHYLRRNVNLWLLFSLLLIIAVNIVLAIYFLDKMGAVWQQYEKKESELSMTVAALNRTQNELDYYKELSDNLTKMLYEEKSNKLEFQQQFNSIYNMTINRLKDVNASLNAKIKTIKYLNDKINSQLEKISSLEGEISMLNSKINSAKESLALARSKFERVVDNADDISSQIDKCKNDVTIECIEAIDEEYNDLENSIESLDSRIKSVELVLESS